MFRQSNVEFKTEDQITLRGWLYSPKNKPAPGIIMTHGFSALKEHYLAQFAEVFVKAGMFVLVYDHRNFGESEGSSPLEVDPELQVRDMRNAITFLQKTRGVNREKIGLWGSSLSAGHIITLAAKDKRVKAAVLQVPYVCGHHAYLKAKQPDVWEIIQKKYERDRQKRVEGSPPAMTVVATQNPLKAAIMTQPEAFEFFTSVPHWQNQVTLKSLENVGNYSPIEVIDQVSIPLLFIIAADDSICPAKLAFQAYEKANHPKEYLVISGEHFSPFNEQFAVSSEAACKWFLKFLF